MYIDCSGNYKDTLNIHIFYTLIFSMQFSQNKELLEALLATKGTTLVEASPRDTIWGIGLGAKNEKALDKKQWRGTNWLGEALTQVREELLKENGQ